MRLRHIEVFHAVYTTGSVTNAARVLHVSQPSVSKVLSHAEKQLGFVLFERVKGQLVPTPEAHELFADVSRVYEGVDRLRLRSQNLKAQKSGHIRVATTPALSLEILPRAIAGFLDGHPDATFDIVTLHFAQVTRAVADREVDLGIVFEPSSQPGLAEEVLAPSEVVAVAPPGWFNSDARLSLPDLAQRPLVRLHKRDPLGQLLSAQLTRSGVELAAVATVETYHVAKSLARHGVGVAVLDEVTARSGGLEGLALHRIEPGLEFTMTALWLEMAPLSLAARAFLEVLRSEIERLLSEDVASAA